MPDLSFFALRERITALRWAPYREVISALGDQQVLLYHPRQQRRMPLCTLPLQDEQQMYPYRVCSWRPCSPGRKPLLLALGGDAGLVELRELSQASCSLIHTYGAHSPEVACFLPAAKPYRRRITALAWSPDRRLLASASEDTAIHVWDTTTGRTYLEVSDERYRARSLLAWCNKRMLVSGTGTRLVVWHASSGQIVNTFALATRFYDETPDRYALSPDGTVVAVAAGNTVIGYHLPGGQEVFTYTPPDLVSRYVDPDREALLAWASSGMLASWFACEEERIFLWDARTLQLQDTLVSPAPLYCLDWSADGRQLGWGGDGYLAVAEVIPSLHAPQ